MASQILQYEFFIQKSMEMDKTECKLPEYSQKHFEQVKKKTQHKKGNLKRAAY